MQTDVLQTVRDMYWQALDALVGPGAPGEEIVFEEGSTADGRRFVRWSRRSVPGGEEAAGVAAPTTVDFSARERIGLVSLLRDRVVLSRVRMIARDDDGNEHVWAAGELNVASQVVAGSPCAGPSGSGGGDGLGESAVWWMDDDGAILVDGWASDERFFGAVVDVRRDVAHRREAVRAALRENIEAAVEHHAAVVAQPFWLQRFVAFGDAAVADEIATRLSSGGALAFTLFDRGADDRPLRIDAAETGILAGDADILSPSTGGAEIGEWRLSAMIAAGHVVVPGLDVPSAGGSWAEVVRARPSDALLLGLLAGYTTAGGELVAVGPWRGEPTHFAAIQQVTGFSAHRLASRLRELGFPVPPDFDEVPAPTPFVLAVVDAVIDSPIPARQLTRELVARIAAEHALSAFEAETQLAAHLLKVDSAADPAADDSAPRGTDTIDEAPVVVPWDDPRRVLFVDPTAMMSPLLDHAIPVHPAHVRLSAKAFGLPTKAVVRIFRADGYVIDDDESLSRTAALKKIDLRLASGDSWAELPVLPPRSIISTASISLTSAETGRTPAKLAVRCERLGYVVERVPQVAKGLRKTCRILLSDDLTGTPPLLSADDEVSALRVCAVAVRCGLPVGEIVDLYVELGFRVRDPRTELPRRHPAPLSTP